MAGQGAIVRSYFSSSFFIRLDLGIIRQINRGFEMVVVGVAAGAEFHRLHAEGE